MEPYSQTIAKFLCGLKLEEMPQGVVDKAKLVFLDTLGIALASSTMDFGRMVMNVAQKLGGAPTSRLIGSPLKVAAANAVLANGTLAHGLDYDDTLEEAIVHTGCCAGMTALAVGEELRASGKAVLEAAIAGTEVMCKIGLVHRGSFMRGAFIRLLFAPPLAPPLRPANFTASTRFNGAMPSDCAAVKARASSNIWPTAPGPNDCTRAGRRTAE